MTRTRAAARVVSTASLPTDTRQTEEPARPFRPRWAHRRVSAGWIELGADYFFDAFTNGSAYVGAGLSLGNHSIPDSDGSYENGGLQGKASAGYEMFRASTIRLLGQLDATLPMYRLARTSIDATTLVEDTDHVYAPTFTLTLGLGWGSRAN